MNNEQVSIEKTAAELMFDGYEDGMLTQGLNYKKYMDFGEIPYDKVGWFYMVRTYFSIYSQLNFVIFPEKRNCRPKQ
jgi:hypothetical protein